MRLLVNADLTMSDEEVNQEMDSGQPTRILKIGSVSTKVLKSFNNATKKAIVVPTGVISLAALVARRGGIKTVNGKRNTKRASKRASSSGGIA